MFLCFCVVPTTCITNLCVPGRHRTESNETLQRYCLLEKSETVLGFCTSMHQNHKGSVVFEIKVKQLKGFATYASLIKPSCVCVCVCLCVSACFCAFLCFCVFLNVSVCFCVFLVVSVFLCVSKCFCVFLCVSVCFCVFLCVSRCVCVFLCVSVCFCVFLNVSVWF